MSENKSDTILMSRYNPDGAKLEEILSTISDELEAKTNLIRDNPKLQYAVTNNELIIDSLRKCVDTWLDSMEKMESLFGPDNGPSSPRA